MDTMGTMDTLIGELEDIRKKLDALFDIDNSSKRLSGKFREAVGKQQDIEERELNTRANKIVQEIWLLAYEPILGDVKSLTDLAEGLASIVGDR